MKHKLFMTLLMMGLMLLPGLCRADGMSILESERILESELQTLVQRYDGKAIVKVTLTPYTEQDNLPSTPFMVKDLVLTDTNGQILLKNALVTILTVKSPLPKAVEDIVNDRVKRLGVSVKIKVENMPPELLQMQNEQQALLDSKKPLDDKAIKPMQIGDLVPWLLWGGAVICGLISLGLFLNQKSASKLVSTISTGFKELKDSSSSPMEGVAEALQAVVESTNAAKNASSQTTGETSMNAYPLESLLAILADSYWAKEDGYAAHIWQNLSIQIKRKLMDIGPSYLDEYGKFVSKLQAKALGLEQDPAYLSPLPIWQFDNTTMSDLCRKNPGILRNLSSLRLKFLDISVKERMELASTEDYQQVGGLPDFNRIPQSQKRALPKRFGIAVRDVDQERELLGLSNPSRDLVSEAVSIGWLTQFSREKAESILQEFSARQLAQAWEGPAEVLEIIEKLLPEKKRALLLGYLDTIKPSRESESYKAIHRKIVENWESSEGGAGYSDVTLVGGQEAA